MPFAREREKEREGERGRCHISLSLFASLFLKIGREGTMPFASQKNVSAIKLPVLTRPMLRTCWTVRGFIGGGRCAIPSPPRL